MYNLPRLCFGMKYDKGITSNDLVGARLHVLLFLNGNTEQMLIISMFMKGEVAAPSMFLLFNCGGGLSTSIHLLEVDARRYRQKRFSNILLPASGRHSASRGSATQHCITLHICLQLHQHLSDICLGTELDNFNIIESLKGSSSLKVKEGQ